MPLAGNLLLFVALSAFRLLSFWLETTALLPSNGSTATRTAVGPVDIQVLAGLKSFTSSMTRRGIGAM
jgi:hypothetical protein